MLTYRRPSAMRLFREVEQQLRVCRSFHRCIQRLIYGECEFTLDEREVPHQAVVNPKPPTVTKRVAVGLLDGCTSRGAEVREEEWRLYVCGELAQVTVIPGGLDAPEDGWSVGIDAVPADAEAIPVGRFDTEAGVEALIDYSGVQWY